ncbi:MAG: CDP-glycerol glycerophosphotransferase family protein [Desulfovibrionales bacterium]
MFYIQELIKFVLNIFGNIVLGISYFIPKHKNVWVFGAWWGTKFLDNPKHLFLYVNKRHPHIKAIWLSRKRHVIASMREMGYEAYSIYSVKGCWYSLRCAVAVLSHFQVSDFTPLPIHQRTKLIQLTHGIPLKKIGYDDNLRGKRHPWLYKTKTALGRILEPTLRRSYDLATCTSEEAKLKFSSVYKLSLDRIKITGYPRNDTMLTPPVNTSLQENIRGIYMPTFRGKVFSEFNLFEKYNFNINKLDKYLKQANISLYFKLHPANYPTADLVKLINSSDNIFLYHEEDIYDSLNQFDFLITDYSSIFFDYLLLDKPIIFAPFDLKKYKKEDREHYYAYKDITPGPKAKNWDEVVDLIKESIANPDKYKEERKKIRDKFHAYQDKNSCQRVYKEIVKVLN